MLSRFPAHVTRRLALVVDDREDLAQLLKIWMKLQGFEVACAGSAGAAREIVEARAGELCLILSDVNLPDTQNADWLNQLSNQYPEILVLAMSGSPLRTCNLRLQVLLKPFSFDAFGLALGHKPLNTPSEHPSAEVLLAYCENPELDMDIVEGIEAHLADCGECCRKVVTIVKGLMLKRIQ